MADLKHSMDLFTHERYFSRQATLLARESALVKFAACAVAAKQLGHLKHPELYPARTKVQEVFTRGSSGAKIDYLWYGAKYYVKAIQSMAAELSLDRDNEPNLELSTDEALWAAPALFDSSVQTTSTEARLVAACIMCAYEELSASPRAWDRHLNGIYKLLQLDHWEAALASGSEGQAPPPALQPKKSLRSLFWYFVHDDFQEACECCWDLITAALC